MINLQLKQEVLNRLNADECVHNEELKQDKAFYSMMIEDLTRYHLSNVLDENNIQLNGSDFDALIIELTNNNNIHIFEQTFVPKMTRSERLFKEGKIDVEVFGSPETAVIINNCNSVENLRYVNTCNTLCNGKEVNANVYENQNGKLFATL